MRKNDPQFPSFLLTFSDLLLLIRRNKKKMGMAAVIGAFVTFLYALMQPIEYEAAATFKDRGKTQAGLSKSISELFFLAAETYESDALMMMKSRKLYEILVQENGLQFSIIKNEWHFPLFPIQTIKNNILADYALYKNLPYPLLPHAAQEIAATAVIYEKEFPFTLELMVVAEDRYALYDSHHQKIAEAHFGTPFISENFSFTLIKQTSAALKGNAYFITLLPIGKSAEKIAKKFRIEPDRLDKSFLKISYRHPERHVAVHRVNALMQIYRDHVYKEHQRLAAVQLAYLEKRQREMEHSLQDMVNAHAKELSSDLSKTGFHNSEKALEFLATTQQSVKQRILALAHELKRLESTTITSPDQIEALNNSVLSPNSREVIGHLAKEIRVLKQEAEGMRRMQQTQPPQKKGGEEFLGINLTTAKQLYLNYSHELSQLESQMLQLHFIISQINRSNLEISSLSTVLNDPVSIEMISKASATALSIKDSDNRSHKEIERLHADLEIQRGFLKNHLEQTLSLLSIRQELLGKKLQGLQNVILERIQEQILILEEQLTHYSFQNRAMLEHEKLLLEENLTSLKAEMALLPQKWTFETAINQQLELNRNMIEEITKLMESKNISNNLELIQVSAIDHPLIPVHPLSPHLLLFSVIGACGGLFLSFAWVLGTSIVEGVRASKENLQLAGFHVSGTFSQSAFSSSSLNLLHDADLEALRRLLNYFSPQEATNRHVCASLLLLLNRGPHYQVSLAELLFKRGFKVLLIDLSFEVQLGRACGLLEYLEGRVNVPVIERKEYCDYLPSGGIYRFGSELIVSNHFRQLLKTYEAHYQWILVYSTAALNSSQAEALLTIFSCAAITVDGEVLDDLAVCFNHAQNCQNKISYLFTQN